VSNAERPGDRTSDASPQDSTDSAPSERGPGPMLLRVVIERREDGRWDVLRERAENGDRFVCDDLLEASDVVLMAYRPDGMPRRWPR
jgi:hypothetical protein